MPPVQRAVKLLGAGIGAARESYLTHHDTKDKSYELPIRSDTPSSAITPSNSPINNDLEEEWLLDDVNAPPTCANSTPRSAPQTPSANDPKDLAAQVLRLAPPIPAHPAPLPLPVLIPQRRPGTKSRGFVLAYAPSLAPSGIDQQTFHLFLHNLHLASQASQALKVVFLAAAVGTVVPEVTTQIVSAVVQVGAGVAMEAQRRYKANSYLDEVNRGLFMPRGLVALVVAYKPGATVAEAGEFEPADGVVRYADGGGGEDGGWKGKFRGSNGESARQMQIGEVAPLVYPEVQEAELAEQQGRWKRFGEFVGDYGDRRAQAEYQRKNPNSALAGPASQFRSRYADPNHPANSGSLISLVTGGAFNPMGQRQQRRGKRRESCGARIGRPIRDRSGDGSQERRGPLKRMMQENVVYLLIVNMPSEEELVAARARMGGRGGYRMC